MKNLKDNVVVITGAASGIGRAIALELAKLECQLALSDVNYTELEQTKALIANEDINVRLDQLDVSSKNDVFRYAESVIAHFGRVDRVINNAGTSVADTFVDGTIEDFERIIQINFWGVYYGTKAFLPHLLTRPNASIVNVSSVNAFIPFPNQSSYNVSKYAISGLNESLAQELMGTGVNVMSVYPGGVRTNIVKNGKFIKGPKPEMTQEESASYFEKIAMTSAARAARLIVRGMRKDKKRLRIGPDAYLIDFVKRIAPRFAVWLVGKLA
ncbi:MAG: SDR family NAD(P)-dependent oxidoreductase [Cyclobacteriaceae bacterium]